MPAKIKVQVNSEKCIGCGSCVALAPGTFKLNEENISIVINQDGNTNEEKLSAAQSCPVGAIKAFDTDTGEKLWPK